MLIPYVICFYHNVSGLIYFLYCDFLGRSPGRSLWVATIPSTVNTTQNIHDFALWYSRLSVDCLLAAPMVVGAAFLMLKCISSYLDCQYDSLSIDKYSKTRHRGPCCEEMLTNEEFIMKKKYFCVFNDNYIYPLTIIKRNTKLSITHLWFMYKSHKTQHGKIITGVVECIVESGKTVL